MCSAGLLGAEIAFVALRFSPGMVRLMSLAERIRGQ